MQVMNFVDECKKSICRSESGFGFNRSAQIKETQTTQGSSTWIVPSEVAPAVLAHEGGRKHILHQKELFM